MVTPSTMETALHIMLNVLYFLEIFIFIFICNKRFIYLSNVLSQFDGVFPAAAAAAEFLTRP